MCRRGLAEHDRVRHDGCGPHLVVDRVFRAGACDATDPGIHRNPGHVAACGNDQTDHRIAESAAAALPAAALL